MMIWYDMVSTEFCAELTQFPIHPSWLPLSTFDHHDALRCSLLKDLGTYNFPTFPCRFPAKRFHHLYKRKVMRKACGLHLDRSWWLTVTQCFFLWKMKFGWCFIMQSWSFYCNFWINEYCIWEWCIYADIYYRWHGWCLLWWCWWSSSYPEWMRHIGLPFLCSSWGTHHKFFDWQASRQLIDGSNELGSQLVYQLVWNLIHFNCMGVMILVYRCI